ncbi:MULTISPECIES: hypothetical protein [unclassified Mesorhizobium]|uniref:hypothetical protein n=1 Tax=unclassified Mesorhizobium TaxID=325217 RepID=UPI00112DF43C|nr:MULTISPECIES: hypothetical protein [unclassified Mesorhizobium]TPJ86986.1 hypothetical protein FJ489_31050 [Mesorhizobium sp. B2-5-12]TPK19209.1 hypothetical protein FJ562_31455 [Mesorhizobium sp. B2-5-6]
MAATIDKLRPELLDKSDAELERLANEIAMAMAEKKRRADIAAKEELAAEAATRVERVVADIKWLHDNGLLPERVAQGFSRGDGMFVPGMILRAPTAESLVPRAAAPKGEKRFRRRKDPKTGEYVPSKAARKAGVA